MISFRLWWRASTILSCPNTAVWILCDKSCRSPSARASIRFIFLKTKATPIFLSNRQRRRPKFPPSLLYFQLVILFFFVFTFCFRNKSAKWNERTFCIAVKLFALFSLYLPWKKKRNCSCWTAPPLSRLLPSHPPFSPSTIYNRLKEMNEINKRCVNACYVFIEWKSRLMCEC